MREEIDFYDFLFFLRRANFRHIFILNYVGNSYTQINIKQLKTRIFQFRKKKWIAIWYSFNISKVKKMGRTPPNRLKSSVYVGMLYQSVLYKQVTLTKLTGWPYTHNKTKLKPGTNVHLILRWGSSDMLSWIDIIHQWFDHIVIVGGQAARTTMLSSYV